MKTNIKAALLSVFWFALIALFFYLAFIFPEITLCIIGLGFSILMFSIMFNAIKEGIEEGKHKKINKNNIIQKSKLSD